MGSPIKDVSDTAFWIAYHRKLESERSDALFHDPFAAKLAGERGKKISEAMPTSWVVAWTVALRTRIIDEFLQFAIAAGVDTILSLGAGLDARPYRMKLPASLRWIEADYPQIIEYKETQLQADEPHCRLERVKIDLADRDARRQLFARINAESHGILVLTEGVVPYLDNNEVASLADDLFATSHARFWILDYFSAEAQKYRRRRGFTRAMQNAPFKFDPGDWFDFFKRHGWQTKDIRYFAEEAERLGRSFPGPLPLRLLMAASRRLLSPERQKAMGRFAGYALLERSGSLSR
ncbi:MAG TPA: SAM-dependent methyltransferase [Steroidobacteraceae bacterium]|jgi:methyltransferase (TIGR00027 family)|nr:SAM-dependent methyltransferase [Steroidobacteraceae bacterium]